MPTTIDSNFWGVGKVVTDDADATISNLLVDPVTGRLLIEVAGDSLVDVDTSQRIDNNYKNVAMAITDDANVNIKPFKVDPSKSRLL